MSNSFTNQVLAQIELWKNHKNYDNKVYMLPKQLDEKVARLHLKKIGAELDVLRVDQADYIGVDINGPYKPEYYRYQFDINSILPSKNVEYLFKGKIAGPFATEPSWSSKKTELQQLQIARDEFIESISAQAVNGS